jgi:hypothetical protein
MSDKFRGALTSAWQRIEERQWIYGRPGKLNADASTTYAVPGRRNFIYVSIRTAAGAQTVVPARNDALVIYGVSGRPEQGGAVPDNIGGGAVDSVNGQVGVVLLDSDDITEGATNLYISAVELAKLAGIESLADVTDQANVGAAIDTSPEQTVLASGNKVALTDAGVLKWADWDTVVAAIGGGSFVDLTTAQNVGGVKTFTDPITLGSNSWLNFKDADVAHGMTGLLPTDQYGQIAPLSGTAGGLLLFGLSDTDSTAFQLSGIVGSTTPTTPAVLLSGSKKNGTGAQILSFNETVFALNNYTSRMLTVAGGLGYVGIRQEVPVAALDVRASNGGDILLAVGYAGGGGGSYLRAGNASEDLHLGDYITRNILIGEAGSPVVIGGAVAHGQPLTVNKIAGPPGIEWSISDVAKAYIGVAQGADQWVTGTVADDFAIRSVSGDIHFSTNNGASNSMILGDPGFYVIKVNLNSGGLAYFQNPGFDTVGSNGIYLGDGSDGSVMRHPTDGGIAFDTFSGSWRQAGVFTAKSSIAGTPMTVARNIGYRVMGFYILVTDTAAVTSGIIDLPVSGSVVWGAGGGQWTFSISAGGVASIVRTSGAITASVTFFLVML